MNIGSFYNSISLPPVLDMSHSQGGSSVTLPHVQVMISLFIVHLDLYKFYDQLLSSKLKQEVIRKMFLNDPDSLLSLCLKSNILLRCLVLYV